MKGDDFDLSRSYGAELDRLASRKLAEQHRIESLAAGIDPNLPLSVRQAIEGETARSAATARDAFINTLTGRHDAFTASLNNKVLGLAGASSQLQDAIDQLTGSTARRMRDKPGFAEASILDEIGRNDYLDEVYQPRFELPDVPLNPIHETNQLLQSIVEDIGQLKAVTVSTTGIHQKQMEVMQEILAEYAKAAAAQQAAAEANDRISKRNFWVTIIGTLIGAAGVLVALL
ncbi:hypothetical protein NRB_39280 [Novosphingobium sp. 11B]